MRAIQRLLQRYQNIAPPHDTVRKTACGVLSELLGIRITPKQVTYHNGVLRLSGLSPSVRSAALVEKEHILTVLNKALKESHVKDIR